MRVFAVYCSPRLPCPEELARLCCDRLHSLRMGRAGKACFPCLVSPASPGKLRAATQGCGIAKDERRKGAA